MDSVAVVVAFLAASVATTSSLTVTAMPETASVRVGEQLELSCLIQSDTGTVEYLDFTEFQWFRGQDSTAYGSLVTIDVTGCFIDPTKNDPCAEAPTTDNRGNVQYRVGESNDATSTLTIANSNFNDSTIFKCGSGRSRSPFLSFSNNITVTVSSGIPTTSDFVTTHSVDPTVPNSSEQRLDESSTTLQQTSSITTRYQDTVATQLRITSDIIRHTLTPDPSTNSRTIGVTTSSSKTSTKLETTTSCSPHAPASTVIIAAAGSTVIIILITIIIYLASSRRNLQKRLLHQTNENIPYDETLNPRSRGRSEDQNSQQPGLPLRTVSNEAGNHTKSPPHIRDHAYETTISDRRSSNDAYTPYIITVGETGDRHSANSEYTSLTLQ